MPTQIVIAKKMALSRQEKAKLTQLEDVISTALRWRMEAAKALVQIRDEKLYRAEYSSFERYAQERWGYERAYLYQLCQWGETAQNVSAIADTLPERESHARPLYPLSPADQRRAWREVLRDNPEPTARDVEVVARQYRNPPVNRKNAGAFLYYGSKAAIADRIIAEIPEHHCYVETHAGGAAVTLAKEPSVVEIVNDVDDSLINFYQVLRDHRDDLLRRLKLTPYARTEMENCRASFRDESLDPVERARRYFVHVCMSYAGTGTGFSCSNLKPFPGTFANRVERLNEVAERFRQVLIESMDAVDLIQKYDERKTFFYVDPPYLPGVGAPRKYRCEMTSAQHEELLHSLNYVRGKVLISGFDTEVYAKALRTWRVCWKHRVTCKDATGVNRRATEHRVELLWANW